MFPQNPIGVTRYAWTCGRGSLMIRLTRELLLPQTLMLDDITFGLEVSLLSGFRMLTHKFPLVLYALQLIVSHRPGRMDTFRIMAFSPIMIMDGVLLMKQET